MEKIMIIHIVENDSGNLLLELPNDYQLPQNQNLLYFRSSIKSEVEMYQVINTDFFYEKQLIEIRVQKL